MTDRSARGVVLCIAVVCLVCTGGCAASRCFNSEAGDHRLLEGDRVPIDSARLATSEDVIMWLEQLGYTSEVQPWEVELVLSGAAGWAWVVWSTESESADGKLHGRVFKILAADARPLSIDSWTRSKAPD